MNRTTVVVLFSLMVLIVTGCSGGGHSDPASITSLAPTVTAECGMGGPTCPEMVDCHPYLSPHAKGVTVDARWRERLDLCCALDLCEVDGECRYGCPEALQGPGC